MIQQRNISKLANRLYTEACDRVGKKLALRIQETTLERDYCLAWLLCSMTAHPVLSEALAFKGGTALRRVHFGEYRFSEDLDFTPKVDTFMAKSRINLDKLVDYAHRMKMASIIRRLGFVLETLSLVDDALTSKLKAGLPAGAVKLDHDLPIAGKHDAKWGLRLNVSAEEILNVVASPGVHSWLTRGRKHAGAPERR